MISELREMLKWWRDYRQDLERPWTIVTDRDEGKTSITKWSSKEPWPRCERIKVPKQACYGRVKLNEPPIEMETEWQYLAGYDCDTKVAVYRRYASHPSDAKPEEP